MESGYHVLWSQRISFVPEFCNCYRDNGRAINRPLQSEWKCQCTNKDLGTLLFAPRTQATPPRKFLSAIGCSYTNYHKKMSPLSPLDTGKQPCSALGAGLGLPDLSWGVLGFAFPPERGLSACHFVCKRNGA